MRLSLSSCFMLLFASLLSEVSVACVLEPGARLSPVDANAMPGGALVGQNL
jgi:hypothetical protein